MSCRGEGSDTLPNCSVVDCSISDINQSGASEVDKSECLETMHLLSDAFWFRMRHLCLGEIFDNVKEGLAVGKISLLARIDSWNAALRNAFLSEILELVIVKNQIWKRLERTRN